jgi:CubicO group peptidase (beta-lactamase class C family)
VSAALGDGVIISPGFEPVAEVFGRNFAEAGELGAAFAAYRRGIPLVDLWGGLADRTTPRPWTSDTMQVIFSGTKGLVAVCLLVLLEGGQLHLDAEVAEYWPEFAAAGKERVLIRDVVSHTAQLPGLQVPVTWEEAMSPRRMAELLASQPQSDDPRAVATYHSLTYGWLCAEIIRRIDGRTVGAFFADEIAQPLDLELWIGLPEELEDRVARLELGPEWEKTPQFTAEQLEADPLLRSIFANPVQPGGVPWNEHAWHRAEIPAVNAIGTARSVARLYDELDKLFKLETIELARRPLSRTGDTLRGRPMYFGIGFQLQTEELPLGPPSKAFGHGGAGGSLHGFWPDEHIGFSYAMNLMRDDAADHRATRLLHALHSVALERQ